MEFREVVIVVGVDADLLLEFPAPPAADGDQTLGEVCVQDGMDHYLESFMLLHGQVAEVFLDFVFQDQRGGNLSGTLAGRTYFLCIDAHLRLHTLARNLHEAEFRYRQDGMLGPVDPHETFHGFMQALLVIGEFHVYEIHDDDTADIAEPELPGDFLCGFQVGLQGILFLVIAHTLVTAVDVDHVQGFRMFDDQVGTTGKVYRLSESGFYLLGDAELVENGGAVMVIGNDIGLIGSYFLDIAAGIVVQGLVIHHDLIEILVQEVPQDAGSLGLLAENFCRGGSAFHVLLQALPAREQVAQVLMQLCRVLTFGGRTYDNAEISGLDGLHNLLQPASFLG